MSKWFNSTYNVNFTVPVKTLSCSTPFPNSLCHPPQLLRGSISLLFAKLSRLPDISSTYSSLSWKLRANVNSTDSHSGS